MPELVTCFACEQEPVRQCGRCGRPYCEDHGDELCEVCLQPASGLPSFSLYRGSLLALLIGTALAVWILVQPSSSADDGLRAVVATPTQRAATTPAPNTTQPAGNTTPAPNQTQSPATTATPPAATTPGTPTTPSAAGATSTASAGTGPYIVQSGDTLSAICERVKPATMSNPDCVSRIQALNRLGANDTIAVGQTLIVPR